MDNGWIIPVLSLITLLAIIIFAVISKAKIDERRKTRSMPKSTLAKDGPQGGVDMLKPLDQQADSKPNVKPVLE